MPDAEDLREELRVERRAVARDGLKDIVGARHASADIVPATVCGLVAVLTNA